MCRWLAYSGTPIYMDEVIFNQKNSLIHQSLSARLSHVTTNGDGFGIGWYGERDIPGTFHDILPAWNDANLHTIAHHVKSGLFLAHVRASTGTATSRANCHPFRHKNWLFMHNGQIGEYQKVRRALEARVDDSLYPCRVGTTDSELIFYLLFSEGLEVDPQGAITRTIAFVRQTMDEHNIESAFRFTAVLSNGNSLYATRYATDPEPPTLFWRDENGQRLIVSEPLDFEADHWHEVAPSQLLIAERSGGIQELCLTL